MKAAFGGTFRRMGAIARNTFIEASRNRAFIGLGIAAVALVVSSMAISSLALSDQRARVLVDFGLFAISLLEVVIAITMGVILVYKEVDRKTFFVVLTKPIRRVEVLAGKLLGLLGILAVSLVVMGIAWVASLWARDVPVPPDIVQALSLTWMQAALMTAVALFFSAFSSPILSGVFTFGAFLVGSMVPILEELLTLQKGPLATSPGARALAEATVFLTPDLSVFNVGKELILGIPVSWSYVAAAGGYCLAWSALFFALAGLVFERRDFT
ncbi:MAG TPA: ABC transporter permease subunit [Myxococcota bacterium]|nr:ABC transporter permease subunit [Myxococcota bacterium]